MQVLISLTLANTFAVLQGVQASLELEDRFRANKEHLTHANSLATRYQDAKKKAAEAKKLANVADAKRVEAEESLQAALESLTKVEERIRALELEFEQAKRAAYEAGSKEA
jgi:biopolymer transport protein ExbB/TolQ